jgi:hypothetical protein
MMNWLNQDNSIFFDPIEKALMFVEKSATNLGQYGSTQATVLALKALTLYTQKNSGIKGSGSISLKNGATLIQTITFSHDP